MAVTIDIGDAKNVHPTRKREVGERLARWALADTYQKIQADVSGPLFRSAEFSQDRVVLQFDHIDGELKTSDGKPLRMFEGLTAEGEWMQLNPTLEVEAVVIDSEWPLAAVRYAWAAEPSSANLTDRSGLPASPFRVYKKERGEK
jgi:sialate O-acetylesterase